MRLPPPAASAPFGGNGGLLGDFGGFGGLGSQSGPSGPLDGIPTRATYGAGTSSVNLGGYEYGRQARSGAAYNTAPSGSSSWDLGPAREGGGVRASGFALRNVSAPKLFLWKKITGNI